MSNTRKCTYLRVTSTKKQRQANSIKSNRKKRKWTYC